MAKSRYSSCSRRVCETIALRNSHWQTKSAQRWTKWCAVQRIRGIELRSVGIRCNSQPGILYEANCSCEYNSRAEQAPLSARSSLGHRVSMRPRAPRMSHWLDQQRPKWLELGTQSGFLL